VVRAEVIIVGAGPAGAACARRLRQNNVDCLVLDQAEFPRVKLCAGWITPEALRDLDLNPDEYPHSLTRFTSFQVSLWGFRFTAPTRQYAIRRVEFDAWLLERAGAAFRQHTVRTVTPVAGGYDVDGEFFGKYLVGAGGTHCPVCRALFNSPNPRTPASLIAAMEEEFPYDYTDDRCWLWFFDNGLPGYSWYVPKAGGTVNVGIGGKAEALTAEGQTLKRHWQRLVDKLDRLGLVRGRTYQPKGHSYYLRQRAPELRRDNAFLVGDAAGLATLDMGEGIRPALESGRLAAEAILRGGDYSVAAIPRYSLPSLLRLGKPRPRF
jgi:flavin-dependent dehydrogenase